MIIKQICDEDFTNYKKPSMVIGFPTCDWKCEKECGEHCCQNSALAQTPNIDISTYDIVNRYLSNPITKAIVMWLFVWTVSSKFNYYIWKLP